MISVVELSNWRAYGDVRIELNRGTTFLIGMNGVGKTSFLEAVRFAFDRSSKGDAEFVRKGERIASVEVKVETAGGAARVRRTVSLGDRMKPLKTPTVECEAWIDDQAVTEDELFSHLEACWGADVGFVARTAFVNTDISEKATDNELRAHLCRAFDLDTVERNIRLIDEAIKATWADADAEFQAGKESDIRREEDEERLSQAEGQLQEIGVKAEVLESQFDSATAEVALARDAHQLEQARSDWDARWVDLSKRSADLVGDVSPGIDLRPLLQVAYNAASQQLNESRDALARSKERVSSLEAALAALEAADAECPICRRQLDDESRSHAHAAQRADLEHSLRDVEGHDLSGPSSVVERIQQLLGEAASLNERPAGIEGAQPDLSAAQAALAEAKNERDAIIQERGATTNRVSEFKTRLAEHDQQAVGAARAVASFRRLAVLSASRDALTTTVDKVLSAQMDPIGQEISRRWSEIYPDRPGLVVDPEGRLSRTVAGEELKYQSFSAGERTVARLLLRIATVISTTEVPFCWIDEPLEHLDDKSQLVVARTLAQFGKQGILDQVLVTTFEQTVTASVAHSTDAPRVEYLGTSQVAP